MLSMAPVGSAGGAANYFAADNYYTLEESAEESIWYGEGAEMLGLTPGQENAAETAEESGKSDQDDITPEAEQGEGTPLDEEIEGEHDAEPEGDGEVAPDASQDGAEAPAEALDGDRPPEAASVAEGALESPPGGEDASAESSTDSIPPALETEPKDSGTEPAFDPEQADGVARTEGGADGPHTSGAIAQDDVEIAFDPDRPGGLPDGAVAPIASKTDPNAGKLPLSNPSGKVDAKTFENILNGKLPDGTQVGEPGKRQLGTDLTFSMPKSASVLALVGGDKRIGEAHLASVKSTMRWVEANLAEGRMRDGERQYPVRTGNLVYALFQHDTSRALDPQGHIHAVIANMTRMPDGSWRALHNGEIWRNNTVISSIYHATFRDALEKLGYTVQLQGKHGTFEIAGVPKAVREVFSQRREAILAIASKLGIATPQGMNEVTAKSRGAKIEHADRDALRAEWTEKAAALGFDPKQLIEEAKARTGAEPSLTQRGLGALTAALSAARGLVSEVLRKPTDPLVDTGVKRLMLTGPEARTQLATASGIRILSQREAAFEVHHLTKAALDLGLADVTPALIATRMTELIQRGGLVPGDSKRADKEVTILTTKESLATETNILAQIDKGKNSVQPLVRPDRAFEVLTGAAGDRQLNEGQMAAASAIIASGDRIVAVQGIAGAGKSTMLAAVANVLDFEKKPALGLAFQNKMVADLAEGTGLQSMTIARFLIDHDKLLTDNASPQAQASREMLAGSYLVVDEASMISNTQMEKLVLIANRAGVDKLVLVGDRQQLLSIDAGKSFAVSQAGGIMVMRMDENLRQRTPELRAISALTNQGKAGAALTMLGDRVTETSDRVGEAAAQWLNLNDADRAATMLFTSGRETRAALNQAIQTGLKDEGKLSGEGLRLSVIERVDRSREELRYAHSYEPGLKLEVWSKLQSVGLERGEYNVTRKFLNGKVEVERDGKRKTFDPQKLASGAKLDKMNLVATKEITLHEGDKIRFTANDKQRGLLNSAFGTIVGLDASGVVIQKPDNSVVRLAMDDPMLKRLDLAYSLNMHMAQGITTDKGIVVMGSEERFLSNQRLFNVAVTRVRDFLSVVTDSKEKLSRQLDRTSGDKYSSLEEAGRLDVDRQRVAARDIAKPFDPGSLDGLDLGKDKPMPGQTNTPHGGPPARQPMPVPEKIKGLEL